jgi:hypothetical protein
MLHTIATVTTNATRKATVLTGVTSLRACHAVRCHTRAVGLYGGGQLTTSATGADTAPRHGFFPGVVLSGEALKDVAPVRHEKN